MKILICATLYPGIAGIPKYCGGILNEFIKKGHEVSVLCEIEKGRKEYENLGMVKIYRHNTSKYLIPHMNHIKRRAEQINEKFDLIIILWYKYFKPIKEVFPDSKMAYAIPSVRKVDIRVLNKDNTLLKKAFYHLVNRYSIHLEKRAIRESDMVISLGKSMHNQALEEYGSESAIINPGVDRKEYFASNKRRKNLAIIVANLDPRKGIDRAIEVARLLKLGEIRVYGGGKRMDYYQKMIKQKNALGKIFLMGASKKIPEKMREAKILLMTSSSEGFGLVLPEAMACGLPIIAFKPDGKNILTASAEIVKNGKTGFLAKDEKEMAEKTELLIKNNKLWQRMSKAALKESKKYSWKKTSDFLLKNS